MNQPAYHLAQMNIGRMRASLDDPLMAGFVAQLEPVNALADQHPGFVWRLQSEEGDATSIRVFDDARILINMSVWETLDALHRYVYRAAHLKVLRSRKQWFEPLGRPHSVLWWIPIGHLPTPEEGRQRLDHLQEHGPMQEAFTFTHVFPPPVAIIREA